MEEPDEFEWMAGSDFEGSVLSQVQDAGHLEHGGYKMDADDLLTCWCGAQFYVNLPGARHG